MPFAEERYEARVAIQVRPGSIEDNESVYLSPLLTAADNDGVSVLLITFSHIELTVGTGIVFIQFYVSEHWTVSLMLRSAAALSVDCLSLEDNLAAG
jgi:hypothetical protein